MLLVWRCCLDNKTFETSLPPYCPLKQNNNMFKQLRPLKNPSGSFIQAPHPTPVAGKSTCLKGKPKNTLPDFLLLFCRGTNPGATCMASKKQHKQMHSSVYLTRNLREAIPFKDADFAIRFEPIFTPITYITDKISLQEMRNVTNFDDGLPKLLCPFCHWCQKKLFFASDRGELGVKLKLQVQESDAIS